MSIIHNISALNTYRQLNGSRTSANKTMERLSSGMKINRAGDDAAGLAISEKMRAQIRGLDTAHRNIQDGISLIQTAEGGMGSVHENLHRMRELIVQGANGTLAADDRKSIQNEIDQCKAEVQRVSQDTEFNGIKLLDGTLSEGTETVEMPTTIDTTSIVETPISASTSPNLNVPVGGGPITSSIEVGGVSITFDFENSAGDSISISAKNEGNVVGTANANITIPLLHMGKTLGGSGFDKAKSIQQTSDGGYIVTGITGSYDGDVSGNHGNYDMWVVKLDNSLNIQWQKCLGGNNGDDSNSIQQTSDGGYIVCGNTNSYDGDVSGNHGGQDGWVVKLDNTGNIQWQKCLGGSNFDWANSIQQTSDGGYIVTGATESNDGDVSGNHGETDMWVVKLDNTGNIQWQKTLGGSLYDEANSIQQTSDGGYIVCGYTSSNDGDVSGNHGGLDGWIIKLDNTGNIQWQKTLGGSLYDEANSIQQTSDGGYIATGTGVVSGNHGELDIWVVKLDNSGAIQWQKGLGGSSFDEAKSIQQTSDGGYILTGSTESNDWDVSGNHGYYDMWVVKLDNSMNIQWQKCLGGSGYDDFDELESVNFLFGGSGIQQTSDGGYIVSGSTESNNGDVSGNHGQADMWVVKLDSSGSIETGEGAPIIPATVELPLSNIAVGNTTLELQATISFSDPSTVTGISITGISQSQNITSSEVLVPHEVPNLGLFLQVGANSGNTYQVYIDGMTLKALGFPDGMPRIDPPEDALSSLVLIDNAIQKVSAGRSKLGANQNALEHIMNNVSNTTLNLSAAESRIRDADMAKEMMDFSKQQVLIEAGTAMLAQANQQPENILSLIKQSK